MPSNLFEAVEPGHFDDAVRLGKALFWDEQIGSDGVACATCHFHAGADSRVKNQINPGPMDAFGTFFSGGGGPNYTPKSCDFPFHRLAVPDDNESAVVHDTDDRMSSMGVFRRLFTNVNATPNDDGTIEADPSHFSVGGVNVRRVEPRNTPTALNSILLHRIFFDGRANFFFNGQNPFGDSDAGATILVKQGPNPGDPTLPVHMLFDHAATASQSVGPPLSPFEMSYDGRTWALLGRKMIPFKPLDLQKVARTDSVLGVIDNLPDVGDALNGLDQNLTYDSLIRAAFQEKLWGSNGSFGGFTQMESNFALFFGLSILCYESTLISDDSPYDQYQDGGGEEGSNSNVLTEQEKEGLDIFLNRGKCIECHAGPEFAGATHTAIALEGPLERMLMEDGHADGNLTLVTYPPPVDDQVHGGEAQLMIDPRGKLVEIRPGVGYGSPLAWGWAYFQTAAGVCNPPIDQRIPLTAGNGAPQNSAFTAEIRLRVDSDCKKVFRVDMSWEYPGLPGGDYSVYVGGRRMGTIHMDQVQPPAVYDNGFYNIGVRPTTEDVGNGGIGPFGPFALSARARAGQDVDGGLLQPPVGPTERIAVSGAFKVPSLRNIELTGPYMHNGGFSTLEQVVDFYTGGAHFAVQNRADLDPEVDGIGGMNEERKAALVAFMKTLTDERVRFERAPFDHPELHVPNGSPGDTSSVMAGANCGGMPLTCEATEDTLIAPPIGAAGRAANDPLATFESQLDACVFMLAAPGQTVTETGGLTAQVRVSLSRRPAAPVNVNLGVSDATEGNVSPSALTFTPDNWAAPQLVLVGGVQDGVVDGNVPFDVRVQGATSTDPLFNAITGMAVHVTAVDSGVRYDTFQFEAESGALVAPMVSAVDATASNSHYVWIPAGQGNNTSQTGTTGIAAFTFNAPVAANYYVWARVKAANTSDDTFWVKMDSGTYQTWTLPVSSSWTWDKVNSSTQDPVIWALQPGNHTVRVRWREDGAKLDRVIITSNPNYLP